MTPRRPGRGSIGFSGRPRGFLGWIRCRVSVSRAPAASRTPSASASVIQATRGWSGGDISVAPFAPRLKSALDTFQRELEGRQYDKTHRIATLPGLMIPSLAPVRVIWVNEDATSRVLSAATASDRFTTLGVELAISSERLSVDRCGMNIPYTLRKASR